MREYRAQLDAERARKLSLGKNHSASKSHKKKGIYMWFNVMVWTLLSWFRMLSLSWVIIKQSLWMIFIFLHFAHFWEMQLLFCCHNADRKDKDSKKRSSRKRKVLLILFHFSRYCMCKCTLLLFTEFFIFSSNWYQLRLCILALGMMLVSFLDMSTFDWLKCMHRNF